MLRHLGLPIVVLLLSSCAVVNVDTAPLAAALPKLAAQFGADKLPSTRAATPTGETRFGQGAPVAQPNAGTCQNGATPAAGTTLGTAGLGDYAGVVLPASFAVYHAEQEVTERITRFSQDTSPPGRETWGNFQCLFVNAVAIWRTKQQSAAPPPTPISTAEPTPFPTPAATPPPQLETSFAPSPGCRTDIEPSNGTTTGTSAQGDYSGVTLPGPFAIYQSEQDITDRINAFATDTSAIGTDTWIKFQCFYGPAVGVWRSKQS